MECTAVATPDDFKLIKTRHQMLLPSVFKRVAAFEKRKTITTFAASARKLALLNSNKLRHLRCACALEAEVALLDG